MRYAGRVYRPPSEADSYILQATLGCSWNKCLYCDMYRDKEFAVRPLAETLADVEEAGRAFGQSVDKVFVADGDALILDEGHWLAVLEACRRAFPNLRRVSAYAMATNVLQKSEATLRTLREAGLGMLYIGPESGDDAVLEAIAKGSTAAEHVDAAARVRAAGIRLSAIFLLGAGGTARSDAHAAGSAELATRMDPDYLAALTLTVVPGTPLARLEERGGFELPEPLQLLRELRTFVAGAAPTDAVFRTNHASNYLPLAGRLPRDRDALVQVLDEAISGARPLRPEFLRGL